jgi:hypothetical protein
MKKSSPLGQVIAKQHHKNLNCMSCYPLLFPPTLKTRHSRNIPQRDGSILQFKDRFGKNQVPFRGIDRRYLQFCYIYNQLDHGKLLHDLGAPKIMWFAKDT